jgi:4-hydroxy-3-polyprenylbenzoate decarboxylase
MGYASMQECVRDLERHRMLVRVDDEIDAHLEAAAIVRRVYERQGPAVLFTRVKDCRFPLLGNLYGTPQRARFLWRDTWPALRHLFRLRADPSHLAHMLSAPGDLLLLPWCLWNAWPRSVGRGDAPLLARAASLRDLPRVVCWPRDGGAFITLPIVYTEDQSRSGWRRSNLGMYRIQLNGGQYQPDREVGMHYQLHRGIGVHHAIALRRGERLRVAVYVGGPPALAMCAVMPLPEAVPELALAGAMSGHRLRMARVPKHGWGDFPLLADADFCILGAVAADRMKPEGPFGDHLGYYSLAHDFPVLEVEAVYHRRDAIWPFTSVGRPPQEDTTFGELIHELTGPVIPSVLPGVRAVHAVDAAGVHPLLLALGSERYVPYSERRQPQELLTQANAILGQGQMSLAKYLFIAAHEDEPTLNVNDVVKFFQHMLERIDFGRDLHFQTRTTIDTLDYSGGALNEGSKLVVAAVGAPRRVLATAVPADLPLSDGFTDPALCMPGVLALRAPRWKLDPKSGQDKAVLDFCKTLGSPDGIALIVLCDDSAFTAQSLRNFLWVTFTRSNPAVDVYGVGAAVFQKHWGCVGPLVIDARGKPHHAPALEDDPQVVRSIERLGVAGKPLAGWI